MKYAQFIFSLQLYKNFSKGSKTVFFHTRERKQISELDLLKQV